MAADVVAGPAINNAPNDQFGDPAVFPPARVLRDPAPRPSEESLRLIPEVLETPDQIQGHTNYREVLVAFYKTMATEDRGNPVVRFVRTSFMTCDAGAFNDFKGENQYLSDMRQDIPSLFKVLHMIMNPPRGSQHGPICTLLTDGEVNGVLANQQHNFQPASASFKLDVFKLWVQNVLASVTYVHRKAKLGLFLYTRINKLGALMRELKNNYQRLLASLTNRQEVNDLAMFTAEQLQFAQDEARDYARLKDDRCVMDALLFLHRYANTNTFSIQGGVNSLQDIAGRNTWYAIHHYKGDFDSLTEAPLEDHSKSLEPILAGIRSFVPSPREAAEEQARNLRPTAVALGRDITNFLAMDNDNKSLGAAKSLRSSLSNIRGMLEGLVLHGVILDPTTTGISGIDISNYASDLDDYISHRESQIRREENQSRVETQELSKSAPQLKLPELHGFSSWLSWKSQADLLLPLHKSDLIKRQLVRVSLKNKEDIVRCRDIGYKEIMNYLELRYSSPLLIPALIEDCLKMHRAHNERTSYENLTNFVSLLNQLRAHKSEDKLNLHVRQKLAPILLHSINLSLFYRDIGRKEAELKRSEEESGQAPDGASVVSFAVGDESEKERREFWITEMLTYLTVVRKIVSQQQAENQGRYKNNSNNRNFSSSSSQEPSCPVCHQNHVNKQGARVTALSRCEQWRDLDVKARFRAIKQFSHCVRCTRAKSDPGHTRGSCNFAEQNNIQCNHCSPPSKTHHPLLHDADLLRGPQTPKPGKGRGGQGGGGGGQGGRKGQGGGRPGPRGRGKGGGRNGNFQAASSGTAGDGEADQVDGDQAPHDDGDHGQDDDPYSDANLEPLVPLSRDTLMVNGSYKANHLARFSLDTARLFLTCCSLITLKCGSYKETGCALLDSGSSMGYTTLSFAKKTQMRQQGTWNGTVETIHGSKKSEHPIFIANILDIEGKIHKTKLLGTKRIGDKHLLPPELHRDLCRDFKISKSSVQNYGGPIDLLLGLDVSSLLSSKHLDLNCSKHPELFLCSSPLNREYFFCGAIGREMLSDEMVRTLTFKSDILCFSICHSEASPHPDSIQVSKNNDKIFDVRSGPWSFVSRPLRVFLALSAIITSRLGPGGSPAPSLTTGQVSFTDDNNYPAPQVTCVDTQYQHLSVYVSKSSSVCDKLETTMGIPSIHCIDCSKKVQGCKVCRYLNSQVSLNDLRQLQIIRSLMSVRPHPDHSDRFQIHCDYPFTVNVEEAFAAKHSNMHIAKKNTERLRLRLIKIGMEQIFHEEILKVVKQGHCKVRDDFTPQLSPHSFVFLNYVEKSNSTSQAVRPVSNSGAKNKLGYNINDASFSGPNLLTNGLQCLLAFRLYSCGYTADLSRAYRSLVSSQTANDLRCFYWYLDVGDPGTICVYSFTAVTFGDRCAAAMLECALREYVAPAARTPEVKTCIDSSRLVDDFTGSLRDPSRVPAIKQDLTQALEKYSFVLKTFNYSGQKDEDGKEITINVLGLFWNCSLDLLTLQTTYFCGEKRRGKQIGPEMSTNEILTIPITKNLIAKILGMTFSYDNVLLGPVVASMRVLFSRVCRVLKDWDTDLLAVNPELDREARDVLCSIVNVKDRIKPLKREIIPQDYELSKVVISCDSSMFCFCYLLYFISKNKKGHCVSRLVLARPKVHQFSVPIGELMSIAAGTRFVSMDLLNLLPQIKDDIMKKGVHIICQTDSMCSASSLSPFKIHKDVKFRNLNLMTHRCGYEIVTLFPKIVLSYVHSKSENIPADLCTRMSLNSVEYANSDFYREGDKIWKDDKWPSKQSIFLQFRHGEEVMFSSPKSEQELASCHRCSLSDNFCHNNSTLRSRHPRQAESEQRRPRTTGHLDRQRYEKLLRNCGSFVKVIRVISVILNLFRRTKTFLRDEAFAIIANSHQKYFTIDKNTSLYPFCGEDGLMRARLRLSDSDGSELQVSNNPVIISHRDCRLTWLLIDNAHTVNIHLGHPAHLNATLTTARLRHLPYSVHLTRAAASVKQHIGTCPICLHYLAQPEKVGLGSPRMIRYLKNNYYAFSVVSADQLGPFTRAAFVNSRRQVNYYILLIVCGLTSAVNCEILEDNTRRSVTMGLYLHSQRYVKPRLLLVDAGSSVNPNPGSDTYKHFFGDHTMEICQVGASHQALNFCEATAKKWKKIIKTALLTRRNVHLPQLTFTEIRSMLEAVNFLFNSKPINVPEQDESFLAPLHLIKLDWYQQSENNLLSGSASQFVSNLNLLRESLGSAVQVFTRILKQILLATTRNHLRRYPQSNPFLKGDVVLYIKHTGYKLCEVEEVKPQYCVVWSTDRIPPVLKSVHCSLLVLVFRPQSGCEAFTDQLGGDQEDEGQSVHVIQGSKRNIFSQYFSPVLGQHTSNEESPAPAPAQCQAQSEYSRSLVLRHKLQAQEESLHPAQALATGLHPAQAPATGCPHPLTSGNATLQHSKVKFLSDSLVRFVRPIFVENQNPFL